MESKTVRLDKALGNMLFAVKYYLGDLEDKHAANKINNRDYNITSKNFKEISVILRYLKESTSFSDKRLEDIRVLGLEVSKLFEDDDYNDLYGEIMKINNILCNDIKELDRERIEHLKRLFSGLSTFYQYRFRKAEVIDGTLGFKDKKHDNYLFVTEQYLGIKYNFKKIKYEPLIVNNKYIDECNKIIASKEYDKDIKNMYANIRDYLTNCLKYELVINNLKSMKELCNDEPYSNLVELIDSLVLKYSTLYEENTVLLHNAISVQELVKFDDSIGMHK